MVPRSAEVADHRAGRSLLLTDSACQSWAAGNLDRHHNPGANSGLRELHARVLLMSDETAPTLRWFRRPTVTSSVTSQRD
jgi:hypothetical protein